MAYMTTLLFHQLCFITALFISVLYLYEAHTRNNRRSKKDSMVIESDMAHAFFFIAVSYMNGPYMRNLRWQVNDGLDKK
jgi:hypothetical protein